MQRALPIGLAFLAGVLACWLLLRDGARSAADAPAERGGSAADPAASLQETRTTLEALESRLARLLDRLERAPAAPPAGAREPLAPSAADAGEDEDSGDEELRLLRELRAQLALLARAGDPHAELQRTREERPAADWSALDALVALHDRDVERARREVQLLSELEALRRYGSPDLTYTRGDEVRWVYGQGYLPARDAWRLQVVLVFTDGLVRALFVERL